MRNTSDNLWRYAELDRRLWQTQFIFFKHARYLGSADSVTPKPSSIFNELFHTDLLNRVPAGCFTNKVMTGFCPKSAFMSAGQSQLPQLRCHENPLCLWENKPALYVRTVRKLKTFKSVRWSYDKFNETQFCVCPKSEVTIWDLGQRQSADNPTLMKRPAVPRQGLI